MFLRQFTRQQRGSSLRERPRESQPIHELVLLQYFTSLPPSGGHYAGCQAGSGTLNFGSGVATGVLLEHSSRQQAGDRKQSHSARPSKGCTQSLGRAG